MDQSPHVRHADPAYQLQQDIYDEAVEVLRDMLPRTGTPEVWCRRVRVAIAR